MKIDVEVLFHVELIFYGGQGFRDEITDLGVFDTYGEAYKFKQNWIQEHGEPYGEIKIVKEFIGL